MDASSGYTNVQTFFGHAKHVVQREFPNRDVSSGCVSNREMKEMLDERGWGGAVFSGEMNARLPVPYNSVAAFEQALLRSPTYPCSTSTGLVFMDPSSFSWDSGAGTSGK